MRGLSNLLDDIINSTVDFKIDALTSSVNLELPKKSVRINRIIIKN